MSVATTTRGWPRRAGTLLLVLALTAGACGADDGFTITAGGDQRTQIGDLYDPTEEGETRPDSYRESLPRDAIQPVYDPSFVASTEVDWPGKELVIGVDIEGEARAYPVGFLTFREMVIDTHRGIPTLVTW